MPTKKSGNFDKIKGILIIVIGVLVLTLLTLIVIYPKTDNSTRQGSDSENTTKGSIVELGALEYDFTSDKAVKRTDARLLKLKSFLNTEGEENLGPNCNPVYHNVMMSNPDETQILLNYGCSYPNARMFAVYQNEEWKFVSPTNQFNTFGIPLCTHVDANGIDRTIAPVCVNENLDDITKLDYVVR
ncbi:hypothetical protein D3C85_518530 [compost metagenome]